MTAIYPVNDPRSQLLGSEPGRSRAEGDAVLPFQHFELGSAEPDLLTERGSRSWILRAQNVVLAWTNLVAGDSIVRADTDESMLLVLDSRSPVRVEAGPERAELNATSIAVIPPGDSVVHADDDATLLRLHAVSASDLGGIARNRALYEPAPESISVDGPWPEPSGGSRLRTYEDLESIEPSSDRMGRIFRNRHVMVNLLYPRIGPRDPRSLSPHDHDDFEQISVAYGGSYVHHIRAHWGKDRLQWRDDAHVESESPSIAIIPPPLIHTSEAAGPGANRMIDIFAGPRADFSARDGWVLNAADYPMPKEER